MHPAAAIGPIRMTVPWTTAPTVSPTPVPQPSGTMEPRARTYEHTSRKPVSTVISIRRTRVRVVAVIAVGTDRRRSHGNSDRSHSNSDPNSHLRLRVRHRDRQHRQHCKILCVFHNPLRFPTPPSRAHYRALLFVISLPFHHSHHLLNLNIAARKKLHKSRWLISAMLVVFSHLRGMCSDVARAMHDALTGTASATQPSQGRLFSRGAGRLTNPWRGTKCQVEAGSPKLELPSANSHENALIEHNVQ
jgi:hypothetical protein